MLTPQEVSGRAFSKAAFGGYNMAMVDEFLDELTDDYTSLYKENAALKAKLKVLVDKVEEYRATEDSMRAALLTAQRMANTMVEEAEEKKKAMLAGAEDEARAKIGALQSDVELEQRRLNAAKAATAEFLQKTRELAQAQLALIERAPDLTPEEIVGGEKTEQKTEADVNAIEENILASFRPAAEEAAPEKTQETAPAGRHGRLCRGGRGMKRRTDEEISAPLYAYDADIRAKYGCFAGVDEAGRGPLCGPVCVAACILDPEAPVYGINDSKKLSEKKREALFDQIVEKALAYKIVFVGPDIIDRDNILNATMGGMRQAVEGLDIVPNLVLVDGNRIPAGLTMPAQSVVKGDATSASIGAASILAKVSRDRYMLELDKQYPQYQLAKHKGYGTKLHYELIAQYGIQPFYRRSFLKKQGYWPEGK